jgi:hypothetical protein
MINKNELQSVISKYYLNGMVESVKWVVNNGILSIDFMSGTRDMIGKVTYNNFDTQDCELTIFDTTQLNKLIAITNNELTIHFNKRKLYISDNQYNLSYSLADPILHEKVGKVGEQEYQIQFKLDQEQISSIIKAIEALPNSNTLCIKTNQSIEGDVYLEFIFGETQDYSNKINYPIHNFDSTSNESFNIPFPSEVFKNVLKSNRDCPEILVNINTQGLFNILFKGNNIESEYFIVRKQDF